MHKFPLSKNFPKNLYGFKLISEFKLFYISLKMMVVKFQIDRMFVENFIYASTRNSGGKLNKTLSSNSSASILHRNMITWVAFIVKNKSTFFPTKTRMKNYGERSAGLISFVIYIYSYLLSQFSKQLILESQETKEEHRGNRQVDK